MTIWESMGFKDNPYDARYLQPTEEDFRLFVGRENEARHFRTTTSSRREMTVIVEGDIGVGKTSFVNAQQYISLQQLDSLSPHLLPSLQPIQLHEKLSPAEITLSVLSTGIFSLSRIHGSDVLDKNRTVKKIHF
ncbi:TPA: hypothetical protein EYP66_04600 [Candidatus Poribacteria bacterium]|nr:hypothetical protein [Candidatus Poribacteria bacterium]